MDGYLSLTNAEYANDGFRQVKYTVLHKVEEESHIKITVSVGRKTKMNEKTERKML